MMSLQSWWFPETDWDDYKNTRVIQVERCYAGWNKSWGGWCRAWNATKANLKAKKNAPPPLLPLYMPQQPKGKARNNPTTQPPLLLPFQWPGLSLWQVPPYFFSIISPPSAHSHGPACHCGRSRLAFFFLLGAAWVKSRAGAPFSQLSEQATACTNRMQIKNQNRKDELTKQAKRNKLRIKPEGN